MTRFQPSIHPRLIASLVWRLLAVQTEKTKRNFQLLPKNANIVIIYMDDFGLWGCECL